MDHLPIEFYKQYAGLEDQLIVMGNSYYQNRLEYVTNQTLHYSMRDVNDKEYYAEVKPCLVPFQDLTDEQILNITSDISKPFEGACKIVRDENFVNIELIADEDAFTCDKNSNVIFSLGLRNGTIKCKFYIDYQLLLNKMYKEHSHPLADYYIKHNLALRKD